MHLELLHLLIMVAAIGVFGYIAWQDWQTMEIPDRSHIILIGLSLIQMLAGGDIPFVDRGLGLLAMSLPMILMNCMRMDSFGGGDIKMCAAAGFFLGARQMTTGALLGLVLAGIYGGLALLSGKKKLKDTFPLGPFLSLGFVGSILSLLMDHWH